MNILSLPRFVIPFFVGLLMIQSFFVFSNSVSAACDGYNANDPYGIDCGEESGLTRKDIRQVAAEIINAVLQITGIILLGYIIYAGYLWMTAAGDTEQIEKSKTIISACVMGLLIVLSAFSLSQFVIDKLRSATGT